MKLAIPLVILGIACVAGMDHVYFHSFPNEDILPAYEETAIRETVFYVCLVGATLALTSAIRQWLQTRKELSSVRSGLGLTSLLLVFAYYFSNVVTAAAVLFRINLGFDPWLRAEWDFHNFYLLFLAIAFSVALRRSTALLVVAVALFDHSFIMAAWQP